MIEVSMEKCLLDTPYEVLFEIFRTLSKGKLFQISRLCSKFRHVAGDTRLWKDVFIKYGSGEICYPCKTFAFEDIYSEPWPVKVINLSHSRIKPPVSLQTEQPIKVARLDLSSIKANGVTIAAILAKYQCTELYLDGDVLGIGPEAFSKHTSLKLLSVRGARRHLSEEYYISMDLKEIHQLLAPIFEYFKNLETLDLSHVSLGNFDILGFVKTMPTSLQKLFLREFPEDSFFESLAGRIPNLRELKVLSYLTKEYPSLLKFQFLQVLHFLYFLLPSGNHRYLNNSSDLYRYLTKFPALKTVYIIDLKPVPDSPGAFLEKLQMMFQPHCIIVAFVEYPKWPLYPKDGTLWEVSKLM